jgi:hypothetical protein
MLAIASFIAAFPTSQIISEKPIFGVPVFRSGEQRGVRALARQKSELDGPTFWEIYG